MTGRELQTPVRSYVLQIREVEIGSRNEFWNIMKAPCLPSVLILLEPIKKSEIAACRKTSVGFTYQRIAVPRSNVIRRATVLVIKLKDPESGFGGASISGNITIETYYKNGVIIRSLSS